MPEFCDACLLILPDEYFTTRSYQFESEVWCSVCLAREQMHLPPRKPDFKPPGVPPGPNVTWAVREYLKAPDRDRQTFGVLLAIAGYLDVDPPINDVTVRELFYRFQRKVPMLRILQLIHKLERKRFLIVHWALEPHLTNTYEN